MIEDGLRFKCREAEGSDPVNGESTIHTLMRLVVSEPAASAAFSFALAAAGQHSGHVSMSDFAQCVPYRPRRCAVVVAFIPLLGAKSRARTGLTHLSPMALVSQNSCSGKPSS
jgi:hypothetical protein